MIMDEDYLDGVRMITVTNGQQICVAWLRVVRNGAGTYTPNLFSESESRNLNIPFFPFLRLIFPTTTTTTDTVITLSLNNYIPLS